jgi:putative ABC transport system permease protein
VLLRTSARELARHPLRTALAVAGLAVSTAMLVDMLALGAGLEESFEELLRSRGYELRVTPPGALPLEAEATLARAGSLRDSLADAPEVAAVAPILAANLLLRAESGEGAGDPGTAGDRPGTGARTGGEARVFALGVDPAEQGVYRMLDGRPPRGGGEVVVGRETASSLGLAVGDTVRLRTPRVLARPTAPRRGFRVVGTAEFLYASADERPVAMPLEALGELTGRSDRASLFMLRLAPGADAPAAARRLSERFPRADVSSVSELVARAEERLAYFRQLALILGTVSLVVVVLLAGTLMAVSVSERYGTIAALRAVGVSRGHVVGALALESLLLCAVAGLAGLALGAATGRYLESILSDFPGVPRAVRFFVLRPRDLAAGYAALLAAGVAAAVLPAWRAATLDIASTLHREEP